MKVNPHDYPQRSCSMLKSESNIIILEGNNGARFLSESTQKSCARYETSVDIFCG